MVDEVVFEKKRRRGGENTIVFFSSLMGLKEFQILSLNDSVPLVCNYSQHFTILCSTFLLFESQRYEIERVIGIGQRDESKRMDVLSDLLSLFTSGLTFIGIITYYNLLLLFVLSLLLNHCIQSDGIIRNDEEIIEGFVVSGVLDFVGSVISNEKNFHVLVWSFLLRWECLCDIDYRGLHSILAMRLQKMIISE